MAPTRKAEATRRIAMLDINANKAATALPSEYSSGLSCERHFTKRKNRPNNNNAIPKHGRTPSSIRNVIRSLFFEQSMLSPIQK